MCIWRREIASSTIYVCRVNFKEKILKNISLSGLGRWGRQWTRGRVYILDRWVVRRDTRTQCILCTRACNDGDTPSPCWNYVQLKQFSSIDVNWLNWSQLYVYQPDSISRLCDAARVSSRGTTTLWAQQLRPTINTINRAKTYRGSFQQKSFSAE